EATSITYKKLEIRPSVLTVSGNPLWELGLLNWLNENGVLGALFEAGMFVYTTGGLRARREVRKFIVRAVQKC
ncbi:unnamed protein product, partial [Linum tenue]